MLDTDRTDFDFQNGVEVRFGCTFGIGGACDDCGGGGGYGTACGYGNGCGCPQDNYAWEVAWWGLDEDAPIDYVLRRRSCSMKSACTAW